MWQADTFDPVTIDRELGWAEDIGMNCMRVYLHHLAWETDQEGFKQRLNEYLTIADKHHISTIFVFWMIAGILLTRQENNRNHNREYIIRDGRVIRGSVL